jgi:RHS repeat-associated protein
VTLGNGVVETSTYTNRLQLQTRTAAKDGTTRLSMGWYFCATQGLSCTTNNGNVLRHTISYPTAGGEDALNLTQTYTYDALNRIKTLAEVNASRTYNYDRWGNQWVSPNSGFTLNGLTPTLDTNFSTATNRRAGVPYDNGAGYDAAGNQTAYSPFTLFYDAENRTKELTSTSNGSATYNYDGDGRRVKKVNGFVTTVYIYDGFGQLAQEYDDAAPVDAAQSGVTNYVTADHLGSTRLITDSSGAVKRRYDYLPFGEGLPSGLNARSTKYSVGAFPAATDGWSVKFTGKERDAESGLDYFLARYFSGAQGRFTSPDAMLARKEWLVDPQRWNRDAYVRNNLLRFIDPHGEDLVIYTFYGSDLTEEQKRYLRDNISKIQAAISEKFKKAGVEKVEFRDASSLTQEQIREIQKNTPAGIALLGFVNRSVDGKSLGAALGGTDTPKATSLVALGNVVKGRLIAQPSTGDATTTFRTAEVGSHELGPALRFESNPYWNSLTGGLADFFRSNIMDEHQGLPTRPKFFDTGSDRNKRVIEEINRIGNNTPKP